MLKKIFDPFFVVPFVMLVIVLSRATFDNAWSICVTVMICLFLVGSIFSSFSFNSNRDSLIQGAFGKLGGKLFCWFGTLFPLVWLGGAGVMLYTMVEQGAFPVWVAVIIGLGVTVFVGSGFILPQLREWSDKRKGIVRIHIEESELMLGDELDVAVEIELASDSSLLNGEVLLVAGEPDSGHERTLERNSFGPEDFSRSEDSGSELYFCFQLSGGELENAVRDEQPLHVVCNATIGQHVRSKVVPVSVSAV